MDDEIASAIKSAIEAALGAVINGASAQQQLPDGTFKAITIVPVIPVTVVILNGCSFAKPRQNNEISV